jgi:hypothetical protein
MFDHTPFLKIKGFIHMSEFIRQLLEDLEKEKESLPVKKEEDKD